MATTCPVTGRTHRTPTELRAALERIDAERAHHQDALAYYAAAFGTDPVPDHVADAWNALHDAQRTLDEERADVEANPRPLVAHLAASYALTAANAD